MADTSEARWLLQYATYSQVEAVLEERDRLRVVADAAREAECLLRNYLVAGKFPDCKGVHVMLRDALERIESLVSTTSRKGCTDYLQHEC